MLPALLKVTVRYDKFILMYTTDTSITWLIPNLSYSAGPVVLVLYNAGPLDISWAKNSDRVMAILEHFFPAQTAGVALSNILNGTYNPSGRLPNTWPASLDQVRVNTCTIYFQYKAEKHV